ncbi:MAG TPA: zinc ribbon domain-containing protein [Bacillota bacterium]|nr:zinc ribbon domain-containing protein [Bacillota bacterium]HQC49236.1 zinc ribbon domain-containing protein [Bacillota bacterium]
MTICPKCNAQLAEDANFCDACGTKVLRTIFCPNCGGQTSTEFAFCQKCGTPTEGTRESYVVPADPSAAKKVKFGKSSAKKIALIAVIVIVVLAIALTSFLLLRDGGRKEHYSLYLKDGDIFYTDFTKDGILEITSRLTYGKNISGTPGVTNGAFALGAFITFSDDGNRMFFPDRFEYINEGVTLYYRDINKDNKEAERIDSNVSLYAINDKGTKVAYLKGRDNTLYLHDLTDKEKIAGNVLFFQVADNLNKIGYLNDEGGYYLWTLNKDTVKLASDVSYIAHVTEDLSAIYYVKDDSLYKQTTDGADRVKIASDVKNVLSVYESGEMYYTKTEHVEVNLMDYVTDDMAAADASITEPSTPVYPDPPSSPNWWDYDTDEAYEAAWSKYESDYEAYEATCDRLYEEYSAALEKYYAKRDRDYLRDELKNATQENTEYTLFYFDGTEETVVTDAMTSASGTSYANDKPAMILSVYNKSDVQKVKLSEISSYYEVSSMVQAALYSSSERYIAIRANLSVIEQDDASNFQISSDGSTIFFLDEISEKGDGDLYTVKIIDDQVSKPELCDSDVNNCVIFFTDDNKIVYYKDVNYDNYRGDIFIDGTEIDYDVQLWTVSFSEDGSVLYYTDWNSDKSYGTLKMFKEGKKTKVSDDVHDYTIASNGDIIYLYDYSTNYYAGMLYSYNNGDPQKIDDDVAALIFMDDSTIRGRYR